MTPAGPYLIRETLVSVVINTALSLAFFLLVFGRRDPVTVWGVGNYVFDFIPQSFMIALMSTLVPGLLAIRRRRAGLVERTAPPKWLPRRLVPRALVAGLLAAVIGTGVVAILLGALGLQTLEWTLALAFKLAYGGTLAAVVTPPTLRAALAQS